MLFGVFKTMRLAAKVGLALVVFGGFLILTAVAASSLGLGYADSFIFYVTFGWTRTDTVLGSIFIILCGLFLMLPWMRHNPVARRFLKKWQGLFQAFAVGGLCIAAVIVALKLTDLTLANHTENLPGHDLGQQNRTARTLELFPFSGWHMQANFDRGDIRLGSMGFAVDFDLLSPPPKAANEYRIILIGGSGAQGWGASSTERTMAYLLEQKLNARQNGRTYRVINLAMGSSITYQNFVALNRWAHPLQPDLILSYSGINDYVVPIYHEDSLDVFYQFNRLNTLAFAARGSEHPPQLKWLVEFLPNLMTRTNIGYGIKIAFFRKYFEEKAKKSYRTSRGLKQSSANDFLSEVVTPLYIHALKSIRRDFTSIPTAVILQASHPDEHEIHVQTGLAPDFYETMYQQTKSALSGPGWHLANFHSFNMKAPSPHIAVHPTDEGQVILTEFIYGELKKSFLSADLK